jgi:hypothetical protein
MTTSLDLLSKSASESSPFTTNIPSESQIDAFKSAFKAAGFSQEYAEELIGSAILRHQKHDQRRNRKRRLIMFEKRVRQVADTVKRMAMDIPREENVALSLEECKRMANDDAEDTVNPGVEQTRREDRLLFAELQSLVNEGRILMSSAPSTPASDEEPDWTIRQQTTWGSRCDGCVEGAFRTPEPLSNDDAPARLQSQDGLSWNDMLPEQMD